MLRGDNLRAYTNSSLYDFFFITASLMYKQVKLIHVQTFTLSIGLYKNPLVRVPVFANETLLAIFVWVSSFFTYYPRRNVWSKSRVLNIQLPRWTHVDSTVCPGCEYRKCVIIRRCWLLNCNCASLTLSSLFVIDTAQMLFRPWIHIRSGWYGLRFSSVKAVFL